MRTLLVLALQVLLAVCVAIAYGYLQKSCKRPVTKHPVWLVVRAAAVAYNTVVGAFLLWVFVFGNYQTYRFAYTVGFLANYAIFTLGVGTLVLAALYLWYRFKPEGLQTTEQALQQQFARRLGIRIPLALLGAMMFGIAALAFFVPFWFRGYFGRVSADQLTFLLTSGNGDATADANAQVANFMVAPVIMLTFAGLQLGLWTNNLKTRLIGSLTALVLLACSMTYGLRTLPVYEMFTSQMGSSEFLGARYIDPAKVVRFPEKKRNLIHIYMESVENSYYDKAHGGYDKRNLMPDLLKLNKENVYFSNTNTMGGPFQTFGSVHSIAAMINMESGVPMKTSITGGSAKAMFYPNFRTLGDLLYEQGYNNEIMMGADAEWGGLGSYYQTHGNFEVFDHKVAQERGLIPPDYHEWWGYEDDKLYEFAKAELTRLSAEEKPFYFILENADTHFPDGYVSKNMKEKPFEEQYANVIFYSQAEVVRFVEWCKQQDFYDNTTIFITGDHQSMDKNFFEAWDPNYERTIVNMYINPALERPGAERMNNRQFAPFDFFPTTLAALGCTIRGDQAGLGTNLFSHKQTLVEEMGRHALDAELSRRSEFYYDYTPMPIPKKIKR